LTLFALCLNLFTKPEKSQLHLACLLLQIDAAETLFGQFLVMRTHPAPKARQRFE
jgi:hypothetical protein